jgi:superoxide dismutase
VDVANQTFGTGFIWIICDDNTGILVKLAIHHYTLDTSALTFIIAAQCVVLPPGAAAI